MIHSNPFGPIFLSDEDAAAFEAALQRPVGREAVDLVARVAALARSLEDGPDRILPPAERPTPL